MEVVSTNPCAEEPLETYGDCCIGSINLAAFVNDSHAQNAQLNIASLEKATRYAVRFLDNVLAWNEERHLFAGKRQRLSEAEGSVWESWVWPTCSASSI